MYYDVQQVEQVGKRLAYYTLEKYPVGKRLDGRLVAVCGRVVEKVAADVTDPQEYDAFYKAYLGGAFVSLDLYDYTPPKEGESA